MASAVFRRYELKYSSWPFKLYTLYQDVSDASKRVVCNELLNATTVELDTYSRGVRLRFGTVDALLSFQCRATIRSDLESHCASTDEIERMNSQLLRSVSVRGPGRNFARAATDNFMAQACEGHVSGGGRHPLAHKLHEKRVCDERLHTSSLLQALLPEGARHLSHHSKGPCLCWISQQLEDMALQQCHVEMPML